MSFKTIAASMAKKQGVSTDRASAMLAAGTRKAMTKRGISTKHGIPKNVFQRKVNMPGMSEHFEVKCAQGGRKQTMTAGQCGCGI